MVSGCIFDMDGLLFDTERIFQNYWRAIAAEPFICLDSAVLSFVFCLSIGSSICFISAGMTALCIYICGLRLLSLFYGWGLSGL